MMQLDCRPICPVILALLASEVNPFYLKAALYRTYPLRGFGKWFKWSECTCKEEDTIPVTMMIILIVHIKKQLLTLSLKCPIFVDQGRIMSGKVKHVATPGLPTYNSMYML